MISLWVFGTLEISAAGRDDLSSIVTGSKRAALLAYLALNAPHGFIRRDTLVALFWPETDQEHARGTLRQMLSLLRRRLGPGVLVTRGDEEVSIDRSQLWCDAVAFEDAIRDARWEEAVQLYRGPLLNGLHVPAADDFERWLETRRSALSHAYCSALERLAEAAEGTADLRGAAEWWRKLVEANPLSARAVVGLMQALDRTGEREEALKHARVYELLVRDELSADPDPGVMLLAGRLRSQPGAVELEHANPESAPADATARAGQVADSATADVPDERPDSNAPSKRTIRSSRRRIGALFLIAVAVAGLTLIRGSWGWISGASSNLSSAEMRPPSSDPRSIAVMPFSNLTGDPEQEYFADGITEEILNALAGLPGLKVPARSAAFTYKGRFVDARQVGRELGVDRVLEGAVRKSGEQLRISVQLVDTEAGYQVWSQTFDRHASDVFAIQEEISSTIIGLLDLPRTGDGALPSRTGARRTSAEAYDVYLQGRYFWNQRNVEALQLAVEHYQKAIDLDSTYAPAYAGLAQAYCLLQAMGDLSAVDLLPKAQAAARRALSLDESLSDAHTALGYTLAWSDWSRQKADWAAAEREQVRAIELNPSNATARHWYSLLLAVTGRHEEAVAEMEMARELEPFSVLLAGTVGTRFYFKRDYARAEAQIRSVLELDPDNGNNRWRLGMLYAQQRRFDEAVTQMRRAVELLGAVEPKMAAGLGYVHGVSGNTTEAIAILEQLHEEARRRYIPPSWFALIYVGLGEKDQAFEWLERSYLGGDHWLIFLATEPAFDPLRGDLRFARLLELLGLPT